MTLLLALLLAADPATSHQVSIPLDDYEALRKQSERPALTVVDLLAVEGSFARRDLSVVLTGRSSGSWPTAPILSAEGVRLHSCAGAALLSRGESGGFAVTPLAPTFTLRCKLSLDGSDRLEAQATAAVLEVAARVSDGELVASDAGGGGRAFSVVRRIAGPAQQDLPPAVTGHYLVTLLPDEARFEYRLDVRNPARGHQRFEVALRDAEHVEGVDARVAWDVEGGRYRFDLPPGETALVLRGRLSEARFVPPVDASLQYLLLESHPLLRPEVRTTARRVGAAETGLAARFRGAQAYLLDGGGEVAWTVTRLEALKTAGLAVGELHQVWFLDAQGKARGETTLSIANQGAPDLTLPGLHPTFASIGGEPVFLTHDKAGDLYLPLSQGPQQVLVQDAQPFTHRLGFGVATLALPRLPVPASHAAVELRYPAEWTPVYEELAPEATLHLLDAGELATLLLVVALAERLLALAGLSRLRRWLLALSLALASAFLPGLRVAAFAVLLLAWAALGAAWIVQRTRGAGRIVAVVGGAVGGLILLAFSARVLEAASLRRASPAGILGKHKVAAEYKSSARALSSDAAEQPEKPGAADEKAQSYEGLPAQIEIPTGARQGWFTRELLATDAPRPVRVVMIATRVLSTLGTAALLLFLAMAVAFRRSLAAGGAALLARARPGKAPAAPAAP